MGSQISPAAFYAHSDKPNRANIYFTILYNIIFFSMTKTAKEAGQVCFKLFDLEYSQLTYAQTYIYNYNPLYTFLLV